MYIVHISGWIYDITQDYDIPFYVALVSSLIGVSFMSAIIVIRRCCKQEEEEDETESTE